MTFASLAPPSTMKTAVAVRHVNFEDLGICLGAQLIARVLGASVYPHGVKEIGFGPVTLADAGKTSVLAPLADTPVLHWHGDQFDIPTGAARLAGTAIGANQAFAVDAHVLRAQAHSLRPTLPAAAAAVVTRWLNGLDA